MTRQIGSRNQRYDERRTELARRLRQRLARPGHPGLRELAQSAGVSIPTLKHYFKDREGIVHGVLEAHFAFSGPHMQALRQPSGTFEQSIFEACAYIDLGLSVPVVTELHAVGVLEGVANEVTGPHYLRTMIEPLVRGIGVRFAIHIERGEMRPANIHLAAIELISPIYFMHLHQRLLGGNDALPIDVSAHRTEHVQAFVRAYRAEPAAASV